MQTVGRRGCCLLELPKCPANGLPNELRAPSRAPGRDLLEFRRHFIFDFDQDLFHILQYIDISCAKPARSLVGGAAIRA